MEISTAEMQTFVLDSLNGTSKKNPMPCSELVRKIAFKERIINDEYKSYACLPADFRDSFQKALQTLIVQQKVTFVRSDGPELWSGYVFLL